MALCEADPLETTDLFENKVHSMTVLKILLGFFS